MTIKSGAIGIIADDLTGANDTALQFMLQGCNSQILLDYNNPPKGCHNTQVWAISSETRHLNPEQAYTITKEVVRKFVDDLNIVHLFKKLDSTLRGNIAQECLAVIDALKANAAIIVPAFPEAGRTTIGGYHLLYGMPIERTEVARDPLAPISQSHIPTLLAADIKSADMIGHIELMTSIRGAAPILSEIKRLVENKKKLIVADAVTITDLEQIALAVEKVSTTYKIIPCGSAGLGRVMAKAWAYERAQKYVDDIPTRTVDNRPTLVIIGSDTNLTRTQVAKLKEANLANRFFDLLPEQLLSTINDDFVDDIMRCIDEGTTVIISSSPHVESVSDTLNYAKENGVELNTVSDKVSSYLAEITRRVVEEKDVKLLFVGGETAHKCCSSIGSKHLQIMAAADFAIPLCLDQDARWIITKSGNLGHEDTLINLLRFFSGHHEQNH